eukprot:UN27920
MKILQNRKHVCLPRLNIVFSCMFLKGMSKCKRNGWPSVRKIAKKRLSK